MLYYLIQEGTGGKRFHIVRGDPQRTLYSTDTILDLFDNEKDAIDVRNYLINKSAKEEGEVAHVTPYPLPWCDNPDVQG